MFRSEVLNRRRDRLAGNVSIAVPIAWQAIGYLFLGGLIVAGAFLSLAGYSRVETVGGVLVPEAGVTMIVPSRQGVLTGVSVREGQMVAEGAELASVRAEEDASGGTSAAARAEAAILMQDLNLEAQADAARASMLAQREQLAAQRGGLAAEIAQLESQISLQRGLVDLAQSGLERIRPIAAKGFASARDVEARQEVLLQREQQLAQFTQTLSSRRATLAEIDRSEARLAAEARAQVAGISATRAEVARQAAIANGSRAYSLRAPVAGRIAALTARVGQAVTPQGAVMAIVPANSKLQAELAVPSSAIGFIRPGQDVRLAVDAFPYQKFGSVRARVLTVSASAITRQGPNGTALPVYPVVVELLQTNVEAFGQRQPLVSGMTLSARIVTERQTLIEWLFEPLFAVRRR
jgi:membrane fusion protein